jgi:hypothetical protein
MNMQQVMTMTGLLLVVFLSNGEFNNLSNKFPSPRNCPCPSQLSYLQDKNIAYDTQYGQSCSDEFKQTNGLRITGFRV